jgi:xanthine dehydrogenase accessory factor
MPSLFEARQVLSEVARVRTRGDVPVLVEVVAVQGSAYRRPGAMMVMAPDGSMVGTVSGGCLEGDLFVRAEPLFSGDGQPFLVDYDLSEDEMWSLGIGCKGRITCWVRPAAELLPDERLLESGGVMAAALPGGPFTIWQRGQWPTDPALKERVEAAWNGAEPTMADGLYIRAWRLPEHLVLVGAGHDAEPVAALARQVGFTVTVLDPRPEFNDDRRFPGCRHLVTEAARVTPDAYPELLEAYWVVMNHHKDRDRGAIHAAVGMRPRWVGALGPWSRTRELIEDLPEDVQREVHGPVGLDLGADTPEEVAVSIVGELMAARRARSGGTLNRKAKLHV